MNIPTEVLLRLYAEASRLMEEAPEKANKTQLPEALGELQAHLWKAGVTTEAV